MAYQFQNRVSKTRFTNNKIFFTTLSLKRSLTSPDRIRSQREKESDQIRERETRSEAARPGSRDLGSATQAARIRSERLARPGARATQAARLARPEVRCGLGGSDFFWVSSSSFFFFPSGSDLILVYIGL